MLIRDYTALLALLDRGAALARANELLGEALTTLEALPKGEGKASLTVTLDFAFQNGRIEVTPKISAKLPETGRLRGSPMWVVNGALSTQHPDQLDMLGPVLVQPAAKTA